MACASLKLWLCGRTNRGFSPAELSQLPSQIISSIQGRSGSKGTLKKGTKVPGDAEDWAAGCDGQKLGKIVRKGVREKVGYWSSN